MRWAPGRSTRPHLVARLAEQQAVQPAVQRLADGVRTTHQQALAQLQALRDDATGTRPAGDWEETV